MEKILKLLKNITVFGVSQFASKILVFLLLPLYTKCLTTIEYGQTDLVLTTVSLLLPVFTVEIASGIMRFSIENKDKAKNYLANGFIIISFGFFLLLILNPVFRILRLFEGYLYLFYLLYIATALYTLFSYFSRGVGKIKLVGLAGVLNTVIIVFCNVLFLTKFHMGLYGYLLSYILGYSISITFMVVVLGKHRYLGFPKFDYNISKKMIHYSLPLSPNNIAWWGVASANKFVIQVFLEGSMLGLYSVALKIPSLITTVQSIISEGIVLSVLEQYEENGNNEYYSMLYKVYSSLSIFMVMVVIICSKFISDILFSVSFFGAWKYVPLLCISPLWGALAGYLGTFYAASKKNKGMFISTLIGAAISILFSLSFIKSIGVYAVIVGNILAYFLIWLYRWINVKKFVTLKVNLFRDILSWATLIGLAICILFIDKMVLILVIDLIAIIVIAVLNKDSIKYILKLVQQLLLKMH